MVSCLFRTRKLPGFLPNSVVRKHRTHTASPTKTTPSQKGKKRSKIEQLLATETKQSMRRWEWVSSTQSLLRTERGQHYKTAINLQATKSYLRWLAENVRNINNILMQRKAVGVRRGRHRHLHSLPQLPAMLPPTAQNFQGILLTTVFIPHPPPTPT